MFSIFLWSTFYCQLWFESYRHRRQFQIGFAKFCKIVKSVTLQYFVKSSIIDDINAKMGWNTDEDSQVKVGYSIIPVDSDSIVS